ncbi:hypothetical protein BD289DRAFT_425103 [Coniella lustricola]|uniref:Uncharacterized protein n=1 Tax=Coniella lustricola TaxID=2025994 RepID=A0A2T3AHP7_9PEZI|nr:hypothetical protein BD289DRAFT_425103 [Coniella lustricola]
MDAIIDTVAQAISHVAATASASLEEIARSNITRSINRLSAVNESETVILDGVDNLISHVNLSAQFGKAAKLCTSEAIWKLKGMNGSIAVDEYLFMTARGLKTCLETEFEIRELVWIRDPFLIFLLAFFIMSMVFGPAWPLLLPLRAMGFGSLGVRAGQSKVPFLRHELLILVVVLPGISMTLRHYSHACATFADKLTFPFSFPQARSWLGYNHASMEATPLQLDGSRGLHGWEW